MLSGNKAHLMCLRHSVVSLQVTYKLHPKTAQQWKRRKKNLSTDYYTILYIGRHWFLFLFSYFIVEIQGVREWGRLIGSATVVDWPFCGPAVQATKVSLDLFWKSEERWNGEGGWWLNGSSVGGGLNWFPLWWQLQSGWHQTPQPPHFTIHIPPSAHFIPVRQRRWANGHWWCHVLEGCAQQLPSIFLSLPTVAKSLARIVFLIKALFLGQKTLWGISWQSFF